MVYMSLTGIPVHILQARERKSLGVDMEGFLMHATTRQTWMLFLHIKDLNASCEQYTNLNPVKLNKILKTHWYQTVKY